MPLAVKISFSDGAQTRSATLRDLSETATLLDLASETQSRFGLAPEKQHSKWLKAGCAGAVALAGARREAYVHACAQF
jgi:hypothetical protein